MRDLFPGYYRPTEEEFAKMWQECIFTFDANMLLNIYRYTPETREELFDIIEQLKGRIWLPHQMMLEYLDRCHTESCVMAHFRKAKKLDLDLV